MPYFNLRPDFITELSHNNLARLQLSVVIFNCIRISDCPKQAQDLNAVLFHILFNCIDYFTLLVDMQNGFLFPCKQQQLV